MSGFVEGKVHEMEKTVPYLIRLHGGKNKHPSPRENDQKDENPPSKVEGVHPGLNKKDNSLKNVSVFCGASSFFYRSVHPLEIGTGLFLIFFENDPALQAFRVMICLDKVAVRTFHRCCFLMDCGRHLQKSYLRVGSVVNASSCNGMALGARKVSVAPLRDGGFHSPSCFEQDQESVLTQVKENTVFPG